MVPVIAALLLWTAHLPSGLLPARFDEAELTKVREKLQKETDPEKQIAILKTAIQTRKQSADLHELGTYNLLLGQTYCKVKKAREADEAFTNAMPMVRSLPIRDRLDMLDQIAENLYQAEGNYFSAFYLIAAVLVARDANLISDVTRLEFLLGNVAVDPAVQDLAHARCIEDAKASGARDAASLIGDCYAEMGYQGFERNDYDRATFYFERALEQKEWNEPGMRENAQHLLTICAGYSGDRQKARKYGPIVYKTFRDAGDTDAAAMIINDIAMADMEAERYTDAATGFQKALDETSVRNRQQRATIAYNKGMALHLNKQFKAALPAFQESLKQAKGVDRVREMNCECSIGLALTEMGQPKLGLPHLLAASKMIGEIDNSSFTIVTLESLEKCYRALGNTKEATATANELDDYISESAGNLELLRLSLGSKLASQGTISFLNSVAAGEAIRRGNLEAAFNQAERSKARSLVDLEARKPIDPKLMSRFESDSYHWLRERVRKLQDASDAPQAPDKAEEELRLAYEELNAFDGYLRTTIDMRRPKGILHRAEDWMKVANIATDLKSLPPDTVMIQMLRASSTKDQVAMILAWSEKGKPRFASTVLREKGKTLTGKQIEALCVDYGRACGSSSGLSRGSVMDVKQGGVNSGDRLKAILIDPIRPRLAKFKRIVISPDAALWRLPLEALPIGNGKYVIDQWAVDYCYSATQWLQSMRKKVQSDPKYPLLVVANPNYGEAPEAVLQTRGARGDALPALPGTKLEAQKIQEVVPKATAITGSDAQADAVKALMPKYGMLHFATHGLFDPVNPLASSLAFAKPADGKYATELLAQDIQGMSLKAKLAVLSACDTGRGQFRPGDGPIGLTYAFLKAGCPVVVSSRWPVNDQTTALLMADFYRGMAKGQKIGDSLRAAILKTKKTHPQPYYWAPFMVFGDSRK